MKKLELNLSERLASISILNGFKGNLDTLSVVLEDIRKFEISDSDWKKADKKEIKVGNEVRWEWNNDLGGMKDIEIDDRTAKYMKEDIEKRDKEGQFTLVDKPYMTLLEKLK